MENSKFIRPAPAWLCGLAAAFLLALVPGCYQQTLDKEATHGLAQDPYPDAPKNLAPTLRMLVWPDTILKENKEGFESRYGVKLEIDTFINDDDAHDLLLRNPSKYDLVMVSQYMGDQMRRENMLMPVPRLNDFIYHYIDTSVLNPKADPHMVFFIPFDFAAMGISFNIDYVSGFPRKWEYLAESKDNPYLYGRIVITDDMRYAMAVAMLFAGLDPESTDPKDIALARDLLIRNVKEAGLRFLPDSKIRAEMVSGTALKAITWSGEAAAILRAKSSCRFLVPEGKSITTSDGFSIPKGASSPETAALFIEYMLHPYNSMLVANQTMYASVNMRSMKYANRFVINSPSPMIAPPQDRMHMKYLQGEELKRYQDAWAEVKKAQIDPSKINLIPVQ
jgi:spermidine/putrescine-binding protein